MVPDELKDIGDLVDSPLRVFLRRCRPAAPLYAVDWPKLAGLRVCPLIPDMDIVLLEPAHIARPPQEPQQLVRYAFEIHRFGSYHGE